MGSEQAPDRLYELQAAICKTFANRWRLRIVESLGDGERTVSQLVDILGIGKSSVSQHLGIMREKGVVEHRRESGRVFYKLSNPKILMACRLMREVLLERVQELHRMEARVRASSGKRAGRSRDHDSSPAS